MAGYAHPEVLVETEWLAGHLDDPKVRIVEVDEDPTLYDRGHIPNAIGFNWETQLQDPVTRDFAAKDAFERLLGEAGIGNDHTLVLYGDKNNWFATYTFWLFKYYGHGEARVLNGGRAKWEREGRPLVAERPRFAPVSYEAKPLDEGIRAYRDQVLERLGRPDAALVDVRSLDEYTGRLIAMPAYPQEGARRAGHIPGAAHIPWGQNTREDGTFKPAGELRELYQAKGVTPDKDVIAYCRIGERSSVARFTLKYLLGYEKVRNYDGSGTEWGSSVGVPIERSA